MTQTICRTAFVAALLASTALGGLSPVHAAPGPVNPPSNMLPAHALPDFSALVTQVKPAVVSITARLGATPVALETDETESPFGRLMPRQRGGERPNGEARGSGFIIAANGIVATNNHVVKDATRVTVTLDDGTELQAKVLGRDARTDIAVLKIEAGRDLPYIELGQSRDVKPGEWVVAMGNPFGLGGSVTAGIVSAVARDIGAGPYDQFIQVDAPINQGNSGGPLFSQDGKVIGMNTAIFSPTGGSVGIGFAIPSDLIRSVSAQLEKTGQVARGYIGVEAQMLTGATAKALRVPENSGALLAGVMPKGPAAVAGLEPGDIVQAVNGQKIANPKELALNIAAVAPGQEARLSVLHDGKVRDVALKVGQLPDDKQAATEDTAPKAGPRIGLALAPLSPELRDRLDVPEGTAGSVVRGVEPGSPAEIAGLRTGDVIVSVDRHAVGSPAETARAIRGGLEGKNRSLAIRILRNGAPAFVGVTIDGAAPQG
ncbi:MAG: Do family serine endopeptidase [Rhodospirillales bacterium]